MSVASVRERWKGRGGKFQYTYIPSDSTTRYFLIQTSALSDDLAAVYTATAGQSFTTNGHTFTFPALGYNFPGSDILTCRTLDYQNDDQSPFFWNVTASYSDEPIKPPQNANPLTRQAAISGESRQYTKSTIADWQGNVIANSTGDAFDPGEIDDARSVFQVEKNVPYNSIPSFYLTYNDCVNNDDFTIPQLGLTFPPYTLKIADLKFSDIKTEYVDLVGIVSYRTLAFTLSSNQLQIPDGTVVGWRLSPADRGWRAIKTSNSNPNVSQGIAIGQPYRMKVVAQEGGFVYPQKALFLNGQGQMLNYPKGTPDGSNPLVFSWTSPDGTGPPFDVFQPVDFSVLSAYCV